MVVILIVICWIIDESWWKWLEKVMEAVGGGGDAGGSDAGGSDAGGSDAGEGYADSVS